jgi:predicted metal-dependent hydrolase
MTIPDYSVSVSPKAKSARLKVSAKNGLVVVIPRGFDETHIPGILHRKRAWLEKVADRFREQRKFLSPEPPGSTPERIALRVIGQEWEVDYRTTEAETVSAVERDARRLLVFGDVEDNRACRGALHRWLSRKTKEHLVPWLARLAREKRVGLENIVVKSQRTRWASCSARKTISLNIRLIFLPEPLVRYVFLHELAHCHYMNHSQKFWAQLRSYEPEFERLDSELRTAWRLIPAWLGPSPMCVRGELGQSSYTTRPSC